MIKSVISNKLSKKSYRDSISSMNNRQSVMSRERPKSKKSTVGEMKRASQRASALGLSMVQSRRDIINSVVHDANDCEEKKELK